MRKRHPAEAEGRGVKARLARWGLALGAGMTAFGRALAISEPEAEPAPPLPNPEPMSAKRLSEPLASTMLDGIGLAVYTTDAEGRITWFNRAAADMWGRMPKLGEERWCGAARLLWPDGQPMRHDECPMASALQGDATRGAEAIALRPDGKQVPFAAYPTLLRHPDGSVAGAVNAMVDISRRKHAEAARAESESWLRAVFETTPECIKLVAPDGSVLQMNPAGLAMVEATASSDVEGRSVLDLIAPEDRAAWRANHAAVCAGRAMSWEFTVHGLAGGRRRMESHAAPFRLPDGRTAQLAITRDVTARWDAEERQETLAREVDHRAKNVLAVALALLRMTRAEDPHRFAEAAEGRIAALARAHTLLAQEGWQQAPLRSIIEMEVDGYLTDGRVVLHGPNTMLVPQAVQPITIVLHELMSNAVRYGALSTKTGRVELDWSESGNGSMRLVWTESGAPRGATPWRQGFGTRLIETMVAAELGGTVQQHHHPDGLRFELVIAADRQRQKVQPLRPAPAAAPMRNETPMSEEGRSDRPAARREGTAGLAGCRILLAEDEAVVALELEDTLQRLGCTVIGPAGTVDEVMQLVKGAGRLDAAVLDVNLAGRPSFPIADILASRGVSVIFATGYADLPDGREIGSGGKHILLRKPLRNHELEAALVSIVTRGPARDGQGSAQPQAPASFPSVGHGGA